MFIDWREIALDIYSSLKEEISILKKKPSLGVILVWNNSWSLRYISQKEKWAKYIWMNFYLKHLDESVTEEDLITEVENFNKDDNISWFLLQLPLPSHINNLNVSGRIDPLKDIDWFTPSNLWKIITWDNSWFSPCTPAWIMNIFEKLEINLKWKKVTILWKSNIVWKPVAFLLINSGATVISCNSNTKDFRDYTIDSDIVISAVWKPWLVKLKDLKKDAVVVDVWFTVVDWKVVWDVDISDISLYEQSIKITPVPWWVWPLTVANLMKNTLKAYKLWKI